ncbi:MAG: CNNM domain-containing protein [Planctomycetota bacterium]|jgi:CBS domain containing-hemolysin-like protein
MHNVILFILFCLSIVLSGLYSGAETGIYQLSRLRLRLGIENRQLPYIMLGKVMDDSAGLLISILIGTNLSVYIITSILTFMFIEQVSSVHTAELLATVIGTPILFILCELIPKNIFFYRANSLLPYVSGVLYISKKLFTWCGVVFLLKCLSHFLGRLTGSAGAFKSEFASLSSPYIKAIYHETHEEGVLSQVQSDMINRLDILSRLSIRAVMTPINNVQAVEVQSGREELLKILSKSVFTRLPVYEGNRGNIIGYIDIYEVLNCGEAFSDLRDFIKPFKTLAAYIMINEAIDFMQREKEKTVLVVRRKTLDKEKAIGIVTMKDLVEELIGELMEW